MSFRFESPTYLYLLLLIPILHFFRQKALQKLRQTMGKAYGNKILPFLTASVSDKKRNWKLVLQNTGLLLALVALARPQFGESLQEIKSQGVEMMVLFDVSESMMCEDVSPNRLSVAKSEINRLFDQLPGSKVGLVAFAGSSALISPITTDASTLKLFIDSLSIESIATQGTDFKGALEQAKEAFERGGKPSTDPTQKVTRVILIISDGEDQEPGAIEQAELLAKDGIRIFTLAVGTEKGGEIPVRDQNGNLRGSKKDHKGQVIVTTSKGTILKELAAKGRGSFYYSQFGGAYLKDLIEDINRLEKAEFESKMQVQYEEKYQWFLGLAILLFFLDFWINHRRSGFRIWKGRFEVASR